MEGILDGEGPLDVQTDFAGGSVSGVGDFNGDGLQDLIVGASAAFGDFHPLTSEDLPLGRVYVIFSPFAGASVAPDAWALWE